MNTQRVNTEQKRWISSLEVSVPSTRRLADCDPDPGINDESCRSILRREKYRFNISFREPISGLTHCIGAILALVGLILLLYETINPLRPLHLLAYSIFGIGSVLTYTASTLYHWIPATEEGIRYFRKLDYIMIFVLIAATATPLYLVLLKGPWRWSMFVMLWGTAAAGMGWKLYGLETPQWITTTVYLLMSWLMLLAVWPSLSVLQPEAWTWFMIGAFFYTLGAFIDVFERPNPWPKLFGFHEIFHILAVLGTISHFWLLYKYFITLG